MKTTLLISLGIAAAAGLMAGCSSTPPDPSIERGPHGTIAYDCLIEASEPGARIEANGEMLGYAPLQLKIFGDKDGTFHDFGSYYYVIKAYPLSTNQYSQVKYFGTGRHDAPEDSIPRHIYFDMNQPQADQQPPVIERRVYYSPPPYYYGPYIYGPRVHFFINGPPGHFHHHH